MALFPCVVGNHKYAGPQQSVYAAALNGTFAARSKLRLCPTHLDEIGTWLESNIKLVAVGEKMLNEQWQDADICYDCKSSEIKWQLFANVYKRGMPQMDYYGASCTDHLDAFREELRLEL
jgi:hypothetical protein